MHFTKPHISHSNTSMDQLPKKTVPSLQKICTDFLCKSGVLNIESNSGEKQNTTITARTLPRDSPQTLCLPAPGGN